MANLNEIYSEEYSKIDVINGALRFLVADAHILKDSGDGSPYDSKRLAYMEDAANYINVLEQR